MSVEHVNSLSSFQTILQSSGNKLVVVDFTATWCGPCRAIAPHYESLANRYTGRARFLKVDVDDAPEIARNGSVSSMPTFHFYVSGRRVAEFSGADPNKLDQTVEQFAPTTAQVSFGGSGQRLGAPSASPAQGAAPSQAGDQSMREAAAQAAARRLQTARDDKEVPGGSGKDADKDKPVAAASENDSRLKVNQTFLKQMVDEMGFPKVRAEKALVLTGNKGLESAVEWCFAHADDDDIDEPLQVVTKDDKPKPKMSVADAKKRADDLSSRARAKREADEKREAIEREKDRMRSGKEIASAKAKLEAEERKRNVEEKRREKREAMAEKERVRQKIEADKEARRQKFNMPNAKPATEPRPQPSTSAGPSNPVQSAAAAGKIQFRLPDGSRLEGEFLGEQTMADVMSFLTTVKPELASQALTLSQQYPRKTFSQADYAASLADLRLLPRGALTVSFA